MCLFRLIALCLLVLVVGCGGDDEPRLECSDEAPCERGVCSDENSCENAPSCELPGDCLEGFGCIEGQCSDVQAGLCEGVSCERGICDPADGQCVNDAACSSLTEATACLEEHLCVQQSC